MKNITIKTARRYLANKEIVTTDKPEHQGRSGRFWPVIHHSTRKILQLNNITAKLDYPGLVSSSFLLSGKKSLGEVQRFGLSLYARLIGFNNEIVNRELALHCEDIIKAGGTVQKTETGYIIILDLGLTNGSEPGTE